MDGQNEGLGEKAVDAVSEAKTPGTFSLDKFLVDVAYPVENITVYTNAKAANELVNVRQARYDYEAGIAAAAKLANNQRTVGDDGYAVTSNAEIEAMQASFESKINALLDELKDSALHIELRGMAPEIVDIITEKYFTDKSKDYSGSPEENDRDHELIAKSIIKISDANGNVAAPASGNVYDTDDVERLHGRLLAFEYYKIVQATAKVNLNAALFDQATDASFLGRGSDLAGE
jgi:hypothetical protein